MGYALDGWVEFVVEVRWVYEPNGPDQFEAFLQGFQQPPLAGWATVLPTTAGGQPLGALLPDQLENAHFVRIAGPARVVPIVMSALDALCAQVFPRVRGEDGPTG